MQSPYDPELERGFAMFRKVFGEELGSHLAQKFSAKSGSMSQVVMTRIAPEIWERDNLDIRTKLLCAVAIFAAIGNDEVKLFMRGAMVHGCTFQEIEDVLLLAGLETGFPNAMAASRLLDEAVDEQQRFEADMGA